MRLLTLAGLGASAVLLSGCSWMPFGLGGNGGHGAYASKQGGLYAQQYGPAQSANFNPCQVPHPQAPIPAGCDPAAVTVGTGFAQQPSFGGHDQYATANYGSHAGAAHVAHATHARKGPRKSRLRGSLSLGVEKNVAGTYLDYANFPGIDPELAYDPTLFDEGSVSGSAADGQVTTVTYTAIPEETIKPDISPDDVHSTPLSLKAGLEYALTPHTTVFADGGYTYSEGNSGQAIQINSELRRTTTVDTYQVDPMGGAPVLVDSISNTAFIPNIENTASFEFDFTDMRRIDLEAGARHYFGSLKKAGLPGVTPFVGAAAGASHYNAQSFDITQNQAFYQRSFDDQSTAGNQYQVVPPSVATARVELYDSQWVPRGRVNAGLEWQATDRTALAFETGIQVEGGREYSNGVREEESVSIPLTIRGSYNF